MGIACCFIFKENTFLHIDESTNHLDAVAQKKQT